MDTRSEEASFRTFLSSHPDLATSKTDIYLQKKDENEWVELSRRTELETHRTYSLADKTKAAFLITSLWCYQIATGKFFHFTYENLDICEKGRFLAPIKKLLFSFSVNAELWSCHDLFLDRIVHSCSDVGCKRLRKSKDLTCRCIYTGRIVSSAPLPEIMSDARRRDLESRFARWWDHCYGAKRSPEQTNDVFAFNTEKHVFELSHRVPRTSLSSTTTQSTHLCNQNGNQCIFALYDRVFICKITGKTHFCYQEQCTESVQNIHGVCSCPISGLSKPPKLVYSTGEKVSENTNQNEGGEHDSFNTGSMRRQRTAKTTVINPTELKRQARVALESLMNPDSQRKDIEKRRKNAQNEAASEAKKWSRRASKEGRVITFNAFNNYYLHELAEREKHIPPEVSVLDDNMKTRIVEFIVACWITMHNDSNRPKGIQFNDFAAAMLYLMGEGYETIHPIIPRVNGLNLIPPNRVRDANFVSKSIENARLGIVTSFTHLTATHHNLIMDLWNIKESSISIRDIEVASPQTTLCASEAVAPPPTGIAQMVPIIPEDSPFLAPIRLRTVPRSPLKTSPLLPAAEASRLLRAHIIPPDTSQKLLDLAGVKRVETPLLPEPVAKRPRT